MQRQCPIHSVSPVAYQERISSRGSILILWTLTLFFLNGMVFSKESDAADSCKKWFPGHYVYLYANTTNEWNRVKTIIDTASSTAKTNGTPQHFRGYVVHHLWRDLESREGVYDFSAIGQQLDKAESEGRKLKVFLDDRKFGEPGKEVPLPLPSYMLPPSEGGTDTDNTYQGGDYYVEQQRKRSDPLGIRYARFWVAPVAERYGALLKAFGEKYDNHPALAMVIQQETALLEGMFQTGWSKTGYLDGRKNIAMRASEAFPHTPFILLTNGGMGLSKDQTAEWFDDAHIGLYHHGFGAPNPQDEVKSVDVGLVPWKDDPSEPFGYAYDKFKDKVVISMQFQNSWDRYDPKTFIDHMVQEQHVNAIDWFPVTTLGGSHGAVFTIYDVINQIQTPGYLSYNATLPSDYTACGEPPLPHTNLRIQ